MSGLEEEIRRRIPIRPLDPNAVAASCAEMYDRVATGTGITVRRHAALDAAVAALAKKPISGNRFIWERSDVPDGTPIMAVTLAVIAALKSALRSESAWAFTPE
jgi:hypothetical protein